ncbi:SLATT domain-containing protein [Luteolibacter sp. AS25]|uniref:SLATT domain-containing protein n=1 Tax=Luteolibacter sp. AS25 TaxID=3135776 RepID=UPI00398A9797
MSDPKDKLHDYLEENSWEKELNYKLWTTKGARFVAAKRLEKMDSHSKVALTFVTTYLIILSIVPAFLQQFLTVPEALIGLLAAAFSILILVYSLIESSRDFKFRAHLMHECALNVAEQYNRLRQAKEQEDLAVRNTAINEITREYELILKSAENHDPLDFRVFQTQNTDYFSISSEKEKLIIKKRFITYFLKYWIISIVPGLLVISLAFFTDFSQP